MTPVATSDAQQVRLELLSRILERESRLLVREPHDLTPHLHNMLFVDAGLTTAGDHLLSRARAALRGRPWLRLVSRPSVDRSALVRALEHGATVWDLDWSPAGSRLAAADGQGTVSLWDPVAGRPVAVVDSQAGSANALAWSPTGTLASGHDDGSVRLWEGAGLQRDRVIGATSAGVLAVAWSPDGRRLASARADGSIRIWSPADGEDRTFAHHAAIVYALAWSPDGRLLAAAGGGDGRVIVREAASGTEVASFTDRELVERLRAHVSDDAIAHLSHVVALAWAPDGSCLASGSRAGRVCLWPVPDAAPIRVWTGYELGVWSLGWAPDASLLAWGTGAGQLWLSGPDDGQPVAVPHGHDAAVRSLRWAPHSGLLASGSDDRTVKVWDVSTLTAAQTRTLPEGPDAGVHSVAWFGAATFLASGHADNSVRLWSVASGAAEAVVEDLPGPVVGLASSRDGVIFVPFVSERTPIAVWEAATQRPAGVTHPDLGGVTAVAVSEDGRRVATGDLAGTVWLWDLDGPRSQELLGVLMRDQERTSTGPQPCEVSALSWSPDGATLAVMSPRGTELWDVASRSVRSVLTGRSPRTPPGTPALPSALEVEVPSDALAWSPDGARLASSGADGALRIWDVVEGDTRVLAGHRDHVRSLTWTSGGRLLASGGEDGSVRLWDAADGRCLAAAYCYSPVAALRFSADGGLLDVGDVGSATHDRPIAYVFQLVNV